jgi:hypothetical protein
MEASVKQMTDAEFCDQVIALIDGTHWAQGTLNDFCWVAADHVPEVMTDDYKNLYEYRESEGGGVLSYVDWKPSDDAKPVACMQKARYCLVGMVLSVASLEQDEDHIPGHDQATRVIEAFWVQLPEGHQSDPEMYNNEPERIINLKIGDLESWNDRDPTERADVRALVERARDSFINRDAKEQADGGEVNN